MAEKVAIIPGLVIKQNAQFNMIDFYHSLKAWFELNRYNLVETQYEEKTVNAKKNLSIKWTGTKEIDDYTQFEVGVGISLGNYEIISTEKEKLASGALKIKFSSKMVTDYEDKWSNKPFMKFMRDVADKYFSTEKSEVYKKELKNDTYDIYNKAKSFLNLQKFR
jgi:hypothetical protein